MTDFEFETLDVFTRERFAGNPLAVVHDAQGLSSDAMLKITREFNLSETTFILPPEDSDNTARIRIFTPGYEMPFAGHPTVGTAIAIAARHKGNQDLRLELNAGLFHVRVDQERDVAFAEFQNPNAPVAIGPAPESARLAAALSLEPAEIESGQACPQLMGSGGVVFVYVRAAMESVKRAKVNLSAFEALGIDDVVGVYLYAGEARRDDAHYHARMFAPNAGIMEDPATGSAAASLPAHLAVAEGLGDGDYRWVVEQGFEMARPSRIHVAARVDKGAVSSVSIGGEGVFVQRGRISVDRTSVDTGTRPRR